MSDTDRQIKTLGDIASIIDAVLYMCSNCNTCIIREFERQGKKGLDCVHVKKEALRILKEFVDYGNDIRVDGGCNDNTSTNAKASKCKDCNFFENVSGCYPFCKSFHNFTKEDGFCHKYTSKSL